MLRQQPAEFAGILVQISGLVLWMVTSDWSPSEFVEVSSLLAAGNMTTSRHALVSTSLVGLLALLCMPYGKHHCCWSLRDQPLNLCGRVRLAMWWLVAPWHSPLWEVHLSTVDVRVAPLPDDTFEATWNLHVQIPWGHLCNVSST
jgi:hypothetical protein